MRISDWSSDVCSSDLVGIGNDRRVKADADRLGMAGVAAAHLLVGRIRGVTSDIAALDPLDAFERLEHGFGAPEAASGENGGFTGHGVDPCRGRMEYPQTRMRRLLFQGRRRSEEHTSELK